MKDNPENQLVQNERENNSCNILVQSDMIEKIKILQKEFKAKYEKLKDMKVYNILDEMQSSNRSMRHSWSGYFSSGSSISSKERNILLNNSRNTNGFPPSSSSRGLFNHSTNPTSNIVLLKENSQRQESFSFNNKNIKYEDYGDEYESNRNKQSSTPGEYITGANGNDSTLKSDKLTQTNQSLFYNTGMYLLNSNHLLNNDIDGNEEVINYDKKNLNENNAKDMASSSFNRDYKLSFKFHRFKSDENSFVNSNTLNKGVNQRIIEILQDIESDLKDLDDEDKAIIYIFSQFVIGEGKKLQRELSYLKNNKGVLDNLKNSLEKLDSNLHNDYLNRKIINPITKYSHLLGYLNYLDEDSSKINNNEKIIYNRKKIFESIANDIERCLNYIRDERIHDKILLKEKFAMIKVDIDEYFENFVLDKKETSNFLSVYFSAFLSIADTIRALATVVARG